MELSNGRDGGRLVSIVAPAYDESESLPELVARVRRVMEARGSPFELVVVENGSADLSLELLQRLHAEDPRVRYVSLSRNFGHQGALIAGLDHARGDVVVTMDADLQHPPEVIPLLLDQWQLGFDVVSAVKRENLALPLWRRLCDRLFYRSISSLSGLALSSGQSDFRLMDRRAVDALRSLPEHNKFLRGLAVWIGYRQASVSFEVGRRRAGESKFRLFDLTRFALDGILAFSTVPLRLFVALGFVTSLLSLAYAVDVFGEALYAKLGGHPMAFPPGWATLAAGLFFVSGVQLVGIGVLGEYLSRVVDEARGRPVYLVRERSDERAAPAANARVEGSGT